MKFDRNLTKQKAINKGIYRAKIQAKQGHPDMKLKHPDWCRDANKGDYTMLTKKITEDIQKKQVKNERFTKKLHEVVK